MRNIGFSKIFCHHFVTRVPLGYPPKLGLELVCSTELIIRDPLFRGKITPKSLTSPMATFRSFTEETMIFQEISFTTVREYKPALDVKATRARQIQAGSRERLPLSRLQRCNFTRMCTSVVPTMAGALYSPIVLASLWLP